MKFRLAFFVLWLCAFDCAVAQNRIDGEKFLDIADVSVTKSDTNLVVSFQAKVSSALVKNNYTVTFTPVVVNGSEKISFDPIILQTRRGEILDYRSNRVRTGNIIKAKSNKVLSYVSTFPYKSWMNGSSLLLDGVLEDAANEKGIMPRVLSSNLSFEHNVYIELDSKIQFVPSSEAILWKFTNKNMGVNFSSASVDVDMSVGSNRLVFAELVEALNCVCMDNRIQLNSIRISGDSRRALAIKNYLKGVISDLPDACFVISPNGGASSCQLSVFYNVVGDADTDFINAAIDMIANENYSSALNLLLAVEHDPRSWNFIGACYVMLQDIDRAIEFFERGAESGCEIASSNLKQLLKR